MHANTAQSRARLHACELIRVCPPRAGRPRRGRGRLIAPQGCSGLLRAPPARRAVHTCAGARAHV
eukprot:6195217-Pleurochrysis_carterae.AAC.1